MNETIRKCLMIGGIAAAAVFASLTGWNGYAVSRSVSVNKAPPTAVEVVGVALPGALGTAGGMASIVAWLAGVWKPQSGSTGSSTLELLKGAAVSVNGFPPSGRIELRWPDKPTTIIQWGPPIATVTEGAPSV